MEWFLFLLIIPLLGLIIILRRHKDGSKMPPSPSKLFLLGNIHHMLIKKLPPHMMFASIAEDLGSVFTFWFGSSPVVVINDFMTAKKVLHTKEFSGRPQRYAGEVVSRGFKGLIVSDYSSAYKGNRNCCHKTLKWLENERLEAIIKKESRYLISSIDEKLNENSTFDILEDVTLVFCNTIWMLLFGQRLTTENQEFHNTIKMFEYLSQGLTLSNLFEGFPILKKIPLGKYLFLELFKKLRDDIIRKQYDEHVRNFNPDKVDDLLDVFLAEHMHLQRDTIEMIASDMLVAGIDTTKNTMSFLLLYLILNEDVTAKCSEEIDNILGGRDVTLSDVNKFHYLNAVLSETMRKSPAAPLAVPHKTLEDTPVMDYIIPQNTTVLVNIYAIHHNKDLYEHPEVFNPERFLDANRHYKKLEGFLPFSEGRRECVGQQIARKKIIFLVVELLQRFSIKKPAGCEPTDTPQTATTMKPKPYKIEFTRRSPLNTSVLL